MSSLEYPFPEIPAPGTTREVAPGIHWLSMPLPFQLDHINLWLIEEESGFFNSLGHIGERAERKAALEVLVKRAAGEKAEVPAEYEEWFEAQVKARKVSDEELRALAKQRGELVRTKLIESKVTPERVVLEDSAPEDLSARAMVAVALGTDLASASTP